jgi:hypothetical protein
MSRRYRGGFTATHHAMLFAWIARAVVARVGAGRGEDVVRRGVRRYGEERGHRMALRAQADGEPLTMAGYLAYGEWEVEPGETEKTTLDAASDVTTRVTKCPWHAAWAGSGLVEYGRLYCLEIDQALVRGFNTSLVLEVHRTLSNDDEPCEFVYRDVGTAIVGNGRIMPWEYHAGHLYSTMAQVIVEELGQPGKEAVAAALEEFAEHYGEEATRVIVAHRDTDFNVLPA